MGNSIEKSSASNVNNDVSYRFHDTDTIHSVMVDFIKSEILIDPEITFRNRKLEIDFFGMKRIQIASKLEFSNDTYSVMFYPVNPSKSEDYMEIQSIDSFIDDLYSLDRSGYRVEIEDDQRKMFCEILRQVKPCGVSYCGINGYWSIHSKFLGHPDPRNYAIFKIEELILDVKVDELFLDINPIFSSVLSGPTFRWLSRREILLLNLGMSKNFPFYMTFDVTEDNMNSPKVEVNYYQVPTFHLQNSMIHAMNVARFITKFNQISRVVQKCSIGSFMDESTKNSMLKVCIEYDLLENSDLDRSKVCISGLSDICSLPKSRILIYRRKAYFIDALNHFEGYQGGEDRAFWKYQLVWNSWDHTSQFFSVFHPGKFIEFVRMNSSMYIGSGNSEIGSGHLTQFCEFGLNGFFAEFGVVVDVDPPIVNGVVYSRDYFEHAYILFNPVDETLLFKVNDDLVYLVQYCHRTVLKNGYPVWSKFGSDILSVLHSSLVFTDVDILFIEE